MKLLAEVEARSQRFRAEDDNWKKQVEALVETRHQELRRDADEFQGSYLSTLKWICAASVIAVVAAAILTAVLTAYFTRPSH
jgi:hypothetical protein